MPPPPNCCPFLQIEAFMVMLIRRSMKYKNDDSMMLMMMNCIYDHVPKVTTKKSLRGQNEIGCSTLLFVNGTGHHMSQYQFSILKNQSENVMQFYMNHQ